MKKLLFSAVVLTAIMMAGTVLAAVVNNEPAPDFTLTDSHGNEHNLSDFKGKYVVLEWVNYECPFVKKHYSSNNMQNLQKELTSKDVVWLSINSSAEGNQGFFSADEINEIMANADASPTAYLFDTDGTVGKTYGAKTTPHMFIVAPDGKLVYQGAIDDNPSFNPEDIPQSKNYVLAAMNEALDGQEIGQASSFPYGCSVKY